MEISRFPNCEFHTSSTQKKICTQYLQYTHACLGSVTAFVTAFVPGPTESSLPSQPSQATCLPWVFDSLCVPYPPPPPPHCLLCILHYLILSPPLPPILHVTAGRLPREDPLRAPFPPSRPRPLVSPGYLTPYVFPIPPPPPAPTLFVMHPALFNSIPSPASHPTCYCRSTP